MAMLDSYGRVTVARIVSSFYRDVLRSPRLRPYFDKVSISGLVDHQTVFMEAVMGGPEVYTEQHIQLAHQDLGITEAHFEEMLDLLAANLRRFDIQPGDIEEVLAGYRALEGYVVQTGGAPAS